MPDTRLTWANLKEHLRRCGVIYAVLIVAAVILSNLLWTMTTPRVPEDERILIYLADSYTDPLPLEALSEALLEKTRAFDPAIREVSFESMMFSDTEGDYASTMLLMTRLATGEGDLYLASGNAMDALLRSGACMALEERYESGWLNELEPWYGDYTDPETGETTTFMAGLKLDTLDALYDMRAFNNEGACLAVPVNGQNTETAMKAAELLVDMLKEAKPDA